MENAQIISFKGHQMMNEAKRNPKSAFEMAAFLERSHGSQSTAQHYYFLSAHGGYAPAMVQIACLYLSGQYLKFDEDGSVYYLRDLEKGTDWLNKAAAYGNEIAHYLLARCYFDGLGVPRNVHQARAHLLKTRSLITARDPFELFEILAFGFVSNDLQKLIP